MNVNAESNPNGGSMNVNAESNPNGGSMNVNAEISFRMPGAIDQSLSNKRPPNQNIYLLIHPW
jgi:hypothetical protein